MEKFKPMTPEEQTQREEEARELLGDDMLVDLEADKWWGSETELSADDLDSVVDAFDNNMDTYSEEHHDFFNPHQATEDFARFFNALFKKFGNDKRLTDADFTVESHKDEASDNGGSFGQIKLDDLEIANYTTGEDEMGVDLIIKKDNLKTALEKMLS